MILPILFRLLWGAAAAAVVLRQQRVPSVAAAWLLLILLLPLAGTLLYLLVGYRPRVAPPLPDGREATPLSTLLRRNCGARVRRRNRIEPLHDGSNAFSALIASLQRASRSIHMEYYIFLDDRIGRTIAEILMRKARAGVEVRVIYDAVGSWRLGRSTIRRLRLSGVRIRPYAPLRFPWFVPCATRRNHRKIVVTDGRVAYLGGINIAKYYLDGDCSGRWRDEHLRIEGDAVADLQRLFLADWERVGGERLDPARYAARHEVRRTSPVQIASAEEGPTRRTLLEAFAASFAAARSEVRISSPYFMPPPAVMDAIRIAAGSGVRVMVMIPACSDTPLTDLIAETYVGQLLDAGVEVYRYEKGFLHAKLTVVDRTVAMIGTANMDYRSLEDNCEVTAFLYERPLVRSLAEVFDRDAEQAHRLTPEEWRRRPLLRRLLSEALRPLSPLM